MNYDPVVTCPFDPAHRFVRSRTQYHLTKCAKNWPCSMKKQCPYDARHFIHESEYNHHISICPQRESVLRYKIVENKEIAQPNILPIDTTPAAQTEENWEDDVKVTTYNPIKQTENQPVIRILIGAPKSERKKHHLQERLRMSRIEDIPKEEKASATQNNINNHVSTSAQPTILKEVSAEAEQNASLPQQQEKSNKKENLGMQPQTTFSYAAVTKKFYKMCN